MKTQDGRLIIISGASRCGKSTYVVKAVRGDNRIVAWDPEAQWCELSGWQKVTTRKKLLEAMQAKGRMSIAYVAGGDLKAEFDFLCAVVMYAGRYIKGLSFIAEELSDVTTPSKAPEKWGILVRRGLKRNITIYAISQRWAEADKTAMGNASEYVCFMSRENDIAYVSSKTGVLVDDLRSLKPFEYIQFDPVTKEKTRKKLQFRNA